MISLLRIYALYCLQQGSTQNFAQRGCRPIGINCWYVALSSVSGGTSLPVITRYPRLQRNGGRWAIGMLLPCKRCGQSVSADAWGKALGKMQKELEKSSIVRKTIQALLGTRDDSSVP